MRKPTSVEEYLSWQTPEQRAALDGLRTAIGEAVPGATEGIAWAMCCFKLDGKALVCYAAFKDHYSLFPMSTQVIADNAQALGARATGKGTIRFGYGERLPVRLVRRIVHARVAEVEAKAGR
ncbi:MAG TPA: DUF1801 domain-containing protein [Actinomycetota bacterium]|nr:DUF1801 domain-containing protein [Actinomycetota bacterium]